MPLIMPLLLNFDDDTGTTVVNNGTGSNGTSTGTWTPVDTSVTEQFEDGVGVLKPSAGTITLSGNTAYNSGIFEVGFWVKFNTSNEAGVFYEHLMGNSKYNNRNGWWISTTLWEDYITLNLSYENSVTSFGASVSIPNAKGNIFHIGIQFNTSTTTLNLYLNGVFFATKVGVGDGDLATASSFYIQNGFTNKHVEWLDRVYFTNVLFTTPEERSFAMYGYIKTDSVINCSSNINATNLVSPSSKVNASSSIYATSISAPKSIIHSKVNIESRAVFPFQTVYRLEKGIALTDVEIDNNFILSIINKSYTPKITNGVITNHIVGTFYVGDVTVNDVDGSYIGSGYVWALEDGYSLSERVLAP